MKIFYHLSNTYYMATQIYLCFKFHKKNFKLYIIQAYYMDIIYYYNRTNIINSIHDEFRWIKKNNTVLLLFRTGRQTSVSHPQYFNVADVWIHYHTSWLYQDRNKNIMNLTENLPLKDYKVIFSITIFLDENLNYYEHWKNEKSDKCIKRTK